jgi:hypothetical protein
LLFVAVKDFFVEILLDYFSQAANI